MQPQSSYLSLTAPPKGFAREARAVADIRPFSENHISLNRVGAARTKGCPKPIKIWPVMTTTYCCVRAPTYRIQLPAKIRMAANKMAGLGPLFRMKMAALQAKSSATMLGGRWEMDLNLRAGGYKSEEKSGTQPVDGIVADIEIARRRRGDSGKG